VTTRIRNDRDAVVQETVTTLDSSRFGAVRAADHAMDLPLVQLPGPYVLSIDLALGKTTLGRNLRFTIH